MVSGLVKLRTWAKPIRRMNASTSGAEIDLVGISAHPVVHVVAELHAALAVIIRHVSAKVAAGQAQPAGAAARYRLRARRAAPAATPRRTSAFRAARTAHAGAVIKRKREVASGRNRLRGALQRFVHRAGMVQHAPGIDHVESA